MNAPLRRRGLLAAVFFVLLLVPIGVQRPRLRGRWRGRIGRPVSGAGGGPRGRPDRSPCRPEFRGREVRLLIRGSLDRVA